MGGRIYKDGDDGAIAETDRAGGVECCGASARAMIGQSQSKTCRRVLADRNEAVRGFKILGSEQVPVELGKERDSKRK